MTRIPFVDRTKRIHVKARPDFKLMCASCRIFTNHTYEGTVPIGIRTIDVMYECSRCGEHRPFGREETGPIKEPADDRTAA